MAEQLVVNIKEAIGVLAVVLSLLFVGAELRHANSLAEAESVQTLNEMANAINLAVATDPELASIFVRLHQEKNLRTEDLDPTELGSLSALLSAWMNVYEAAWKSRERGIISQEGFEGYMEGACIEFSLQPVTIQRWRLQRVAFSKPFIEIIENTCPVLASSQPNESD